MIRYMSTGLIGLGSMGYNLALNIQRKNDLHVCNRSKDKTDALVRTSPKITGHDSVVEMVAKMEKPRTVITMLPHGNVTCDTVSLLSKVMQPGDTIIDCSNEFYDASRVRGNFCKTRDIEYLGVGMSGGARGALYGPAIMVGGKRDTFNTHKEFFDSFCENVIYVDQQYDSGHFVKMVHNGIEYGMLQGISDVFSYCNQDQEEMCNIIELAKGTEIDGYLIQSSLNVLSNYKIHEIMDVASMNKTGCWCAHLGLEYGIPTPTITAAVQARTASRHTKSLDTHQSQNLFLCSDIALDTLRFVFAMAICEGYELASTRSIKQSKLKRAWSKATLIECPLITGDYRAVMDEMIIPARTFVMHCVRAGIPCPAVQAAVSHYDFIHQRRTSMNLLMAQRNYFGQHAIENV